MIKHLKLCGSTFDKSASPFDRILCLGYYDGPTSGLAKCAESQKAYRFELVAWDASCENRIYSLAETDAQVFDSVVQILASHEEPRWPVWVPRWQPDSSAVRNLASAEIDQILSNIPAADLLVATEHLNKSILAYRDIDNGVRSRMPKEGTLPDPKDWEFWRDYLSLIEN